MTPLWVALRQALFASSDAEFNVDGKRVSFDALARLVEARSDAFRLAGVSAGDLVWVVGSPGLAFWRDTLACWQAGAVVVPSAATRSSAEEEELHQLVPPRAIADSRLSPDALEVLPRIESVKLPQDTAAVLLTSGSTGRAKGVPTTAQALLGNATGTLERTGLSSFDRLAIAIPPHFTSALCHGLSAILSGASFVATQGIRFPADLVEFLAAHRATALGGPPIHVRWAAESGALPGIRWLFSSGDRFDVKTESLVREALPEGALFIAYGLTEVAGRCCVRNASIDPATGSVGTTIAGLHARIVTDNGAAAAPGTDGEIVVTGDWVFRDYLSSRPIRGPSPGGFHTGDRGWVDPEGRLFVTGRLDDVFKSAGVKVSAVRIVEALLAYPGVADAVAFSESHAFLGAAPVALVTSQSGVALDTNAMLRALRSQLPRNHLPQRITIVPAIPRGANGKVDRAAARRLASPDGGGA